MVRQSSPAALRGTTGKCRDRRRGSRGGEGDWVRPYMRVQRAFTASMKLIDSSVRAIADSGRCAHRRPIGTSRKLIEASSRLAAASARLKRATEGLADLRECLVRNPDPDGPLFLREATTRLLSLTRWLAWTADQVFARHEDVLRGLASGKLVPERSERHRPRIILVHCPAPVREFLRTRRPRVVDRISPLLRRRRRSRLPADLRAPRRTSQGRAPPLFPVCLL